MTRHRADVLELNRELNVWHIQCIETGKKAMAVQLTGREKMRTLEWLTLCFFGSLGILYPISAFADTYNFYFPKQKQKPPVSQQDNKSPDDTSTKNDTDNTENPASDSNASDNRDSKTERAPIIIHNHNTVNTQSPSIVPPTQTASLETSLQGPRSAISPIRFGLSGIYLPKKDVSSFPFGFESVTTKSYGGMVSLGYLCSSSFTINGYFGAHQSSNPRQMLYHMGMDGEIYPFANNAPWELNPFDLGVVLGASTDFMTDGHVGDVHAGSRLSINFSPKFGLTGVGRIGTNAIMIEAGIISRL